MPRLSTTSLSAPFTDVTSVAVGNANTRVSVTFFPSRDNSYSVAFGEHATLYGGITVYLDGHPFTVTRDEIGDSIAQPIHIIGTAASNAPILIVSET